MNVRLGDDVKVGQTLAIADSKEVRQAKLDLASNRTTVAYAKINNEWAQILDDTGFPKQGKHSVGVARQYTGNRAPHHC